MLTVTLDVLDDTGTALDPAVTVTGRLTVATRPQAWEVPEHVDPATLPSHTFMCRQDSGVTARRQLQDADGRKFLVLGRADVTVGPGAADYWRLKVL